MEFLKDLWVWLRLRLFPLPPELQEMADTARALDLRVSRRMTTEELQLFLKTGSLPPWMEKKLAGEEERDA